ncbi:MAG TPA: DUF4440 domain-containing protein [Mariniphaga sp.]|nr:DUF4440 domain-containing protein [Mariniphaga sp.]
MEKHLLEEHILKLEKSLLQPEVRQSAEKISELLSDNFTEFCSSGRVYEYKRGDIIDSRKETNIPDWKIKDFSIDIIAGDVILAKYKIIKHSKLDKKVYSLRSSIWKCIKGKWKMIFHQGTITDKL